MGKFDILYLNNMKKDLKDVKSTQSIRLMTEFVKYRMKN